MTNITPEQQERFDEIIEQINVALVPKVSDPIITPLKELWEEIKSDENHQQ